MTVIGSLIVPVGGVLLAHFLLRPRTVDVAALYDPRSTLAGIRWPGVVAWAAGLVTYYLVPGGAMIPSLAVAVGAYLWLDRAGARPAVDGPSPA